MLFLALPAPTYRLTRPGSRVSEAKSLPRYPFSLLLASKSLVIIMKVPARLTQYEASYPVECTIPTAAQ
jgi:hypothetical protein